jgi:membrane-bound serine protease (ClpP class)
LASHRRVLEMLCLGMVAGMALCASVWGQEPPAEPGQPSAETKQPSPRAKEPSPAAANAKQDRDPAQRPPAPRRLPGAMPIGPVGKALIVRLEGPITPLSHASFLRRLDEAKARKPDLLIVLVDSPGGFFEESQSLAHRLRDVDWARTVAYVPDKALSGAAICCLGCDEIIMHPDARLGDVGVIGYDPATEAFRYVPEKLTSDFVTAMRALAEAKGRPPALVEKMILKDVEVFHVRHKQTGEETFLTDREIQASPQPDQWQKLPAILEGEKGRFLTLTGTRAVELHLAAATVRDFDELKQRYQLRDEPQVLEHTWVDTLVYVLNHPLVIGLLFVVGLVAMYIEFQAPGTAVGGLLAALCFSLFFWSQWMGGTAGALEVLLFIGGVVFLGVELFVTPGFGVLGIGGGLLIVVSLIMASQRVVIPQTTYDLIMLRNGLLTLVGAGVAFFVIVRLMRQRIGQQSVFRKLVLEPPAPEVLTAPSALPRMQATAPVADQVLAEIAAGQRGTAVTQLRPAGKARFGVRHVDVSALDGVFIAPGRSVEVVGRQGNVLIVREVS